MACGTGKPALFESIGLEKKFAMYFTYLIWTWIPLSLRLSLSVLKSIKIKETWQLNKKGKIIKKYFFIFLYAIKINPYFSQTTKRQNTKYTTGFLVQLRNT